MLSGLTSSSGSNGIDNLYYSQNNLDNTYSQVAEEILRRTNKDISKNSNYRASFNKMAKLVYDKIPLQERNLAKCNSTLTDKSITFFHTKIFEKNMAGNSSSRSNTVIPPRPELSNTIQNAGIGYTMMADSNSNSKELDIRMKEMLASRGQIIQTGNNTNIGVVGVVGDGNPLSYTPAPVLKPQQVIQPPISPMRTQEFQRVGDHMANKTILNNTRDQIDFTIKPFNLGEDLTDSLLSNESQDSPLYQNIEHLQQMDGINPMTVLEDYTRKRNTQAQQYIDTEARQNITAMTVNMPANTLTDRLNALDALEPRMPINTPPMRDFTASAKGARTAADTSIGETIVDPMDLMADGNKYTQRYIARMEERIVNDNTVQTIDPDQITANQEKMIHTQRETQPKYIEKVHYININSVDRNWADNTTENRYNFQVKFNQNADYDGSATISQMYRNIVSVELVSAVMPMDAYIDPFDTRIYMGLSRYPYLLLRIEELDNVFKGTNNWVDKAFSTMIFDKVFFTNTLSSDYISGTGTSIVQSTPKQGFAGEYLRGFMKYNPAYFEKKKFYNNPLANLNRMTIDITDPRGNDVNNQKDVLDISAITYTGNVAAVSGTELVPTYAWPWSTQGSYSYIKLTTTTYFSNRLFRIGDRVIINNFAFGAGHSGVNDNAFEGFINRPEGHVILNLDVETNGAANTFNRGFINGIYIAPPGTLNAANQTVQSGTYYDSSTLDLGNVSNWGRLIDVDLQTQLLFRIVCRDPDTSGTLQPINVY